MAERQTGMTRSRDEQGRMAPRGANPFSAMQRLSDEMDRLFGGVGFARRASLPLQFSSNAGRLVTGRGDHPKRRAADRTRR